MSIGERIRGLRKTSELTQEQLAVDLSIARSTLACYETDKNQIPNELLIALAKYFDVTTDYLLGLTD